ncbi:MAG: putative DNA binding domain-containing protein [Clostridia bacterium]|nr:putative DNA binding domain-containing protein [Clostridia bacterium]
MIDLNHIEKYRENNRIEAKKALGGLPHSIWETYSAFANTLGGIILLGVEEYRDKTLHTIDLPDPEKLVQEFWDLVNNPNKASVNTLMDRDVRIETVNGDRIIVISVPRAQRFERPVYVEGNPLNTYRRNGEGDYRCTEEELRSMYRDASYKTQDMLVLEEMDLDVFCKDTVRRYRNRLLSYRPGHVWADLDDDEMLHKLGAVGRAEDGSLHPTAAGLLMFGYEYEIVREYPMYFLDYREDYDPETRWTDRIISSSGDWSGNLFDFFFRVCNKLTEDIKVPFRMEGINRIDDTPVHKAIREALANCLINADYYGRRGLVIIKKKTDITLSNPGSFRIEIGAAKFGGVSDPRNGTLLKLFNLIDIGERSGSGIPKIIGAWKAQGWAEPEITESFNPDRTVLTLPLTKSADKKVLIKSADKKPPIKTTVQKEQIIAYLTDHPAAGTSELCELLELKPTRVRNIMRELIAENIVVAEGGNRNRTYRLKS